MRGCQSWGTGRHVLGVSALLPGLPAGLVYGFTKPAALIFAALLLLSRLRVTICVPQQNLQEERQRTAWDWQNQRPSNNPSPGDGILHQL